MAQSGRKYKFTRRWCSYIRSPATTFRIKAQNLGTRNAKEILILTLLLFTRTDILTVWKTHCGLGNQLVYILCLHVLNVTVRRTQHIQATAIPLPKFHTRSTTHPLKYTFQCPCSNSLLFSKATGQNTLQQCHSTGKRLKCSKGTGWRQTYTALVQKITATLKEVLRTFPTFQTNEMYLKTDQHCILLTVSEVN
jgi:hypothetical protein